MGGAASSKYSLSDSDKKEVVLKLQVWFYCYVGYKIVVIVICCLQTLHETLKADSSNEAEVYNKLSK